VEVIVGVCKRRGGARAAAGRKRKRRKRRQRRRRRRRRWSCLTLLIIHRFTLSEPGHDKEVAGNS